MSRQPPCHIRQIHLSTVIALMFLTGRLVQANVGMRRNLALYLAAELAIFAAIAFACERISHREARKP